MRTTILLLIATVAACAAGPELRQPVGETIVASSRLPVAPQDAGSSEETAADAESHVTDQAADSCSLDELPIIGFDNASNTITDEQTSELQHLAACLTAAPFESMSVVLIGYSDLIGTPPANLSLGLERAEAVMRKLIAAGVPPGRIVVASAGELQRPRARWGLRAKRVEVLLARGGPTRPDEAPIARGISAEGLLPRKTNPVGGTPLPATSGRPGMPRGAVPGRGFAPRPPPRR